jgi:hypothetical protein
MFSAQRLAVEGILMGQLDEFGDCTSLVFRWCVSLDCIQAEELGI